MKKKITFAFAMTILLGFLLVISVSAVTGSSSDEFGDATVVEGLTSKSTDMDAKVVLKNDDGTFSTYYTYYIYPTFNWRGGMSAPNFTGLNEALGTSYTNASIIRIELLSDCKYIELPSECNTYLKELLIPEDINTTTLYRTYFKALEKINIPSKITTISSNTFDGTSTLKYVTFGEDFAMTSLPAAMFSGCSSLEEIKLPNSVTSIGNSFFANCTSLKKICLGENLDKIGSSIIVNVTNAQIYASSKWFTTNAPAHNSFAYAGHTPTDVTLYYVGTKSEAEALMAKSNHNGIKKATLVEYDATKPDDYYINPNQTAWTIVYGYNKCKAFYGNEHDEKILNACQYGCTRGCGAVEMLENPQHELERNVTYGGSLTVDYYKSINVVELCKNCKLESLNQDIDPLFTDKGYSVDLEGVGVCQSFKVNFDAIELYKQYVNGDFEYGLVASIDNENPLVIDNGAVKTVGKAISTGMTNTSFELLQIKVVGIPAEQENARIVGCAYALDNGKIYYLSENATTQVASGASYASLKEQE